MTRQKRGNGNQARKIWTQHHGAIPIDEYGYRCDIHHIDGDSFNNSIDNLICLTLQEHYEIHYWQEDWGACYAISRRLDILPEEKRELLSKWNDERVKNGTHPFLPENFPRKGMTYEEIYGEDIAAQIKNTKRIQRTGTTQTQSTRDKIGKANTGNTRDDNRIIHVCADCGQKIGGKANLARHHRDYCPVKVTTPVGVDQTIYHFYNVNTGETLIAKRIVLIKKYNMHPSTVAGMINGSKKSARGWTLIKE